MERGVLVLNLIPDIGLEIKSLILNDNLNTLLYINLADIGILPLFFALLCQITVYWIITIIFEYGY